jgi:hypothetical protein
VCLQMTGRLISGGSPAPGLGNSGGGSLVVEDATRPTLKRLPSQTLGPELSKRLAGALSASLYVLSISSQDEWLSKQVLNMYDVASHLRNVLLASKQP